MYEELTVAINIERKKLIKQTIWLKSFKKIMLEKEILSEPWQEGKLIHTIPIHISKITKIAGIDGGLITEAMSGFDLIMYRAVAAIFTGIGKKVTSEYLPNFNPTPQIFFSTSLSSRLEFNKLGTLMRLYAEYKVAKETIETINPTVIFIDGKASPLLSDFSNSISQSKILKQAEIDVKQAYRELVESSIKNQVLLCGVIKDSRSRELVNELQNGIPELIRKSKLTQLEVKDWKAILPKMQDEMLGEGLLKAGERTAWIKSKTPTWLSPVLDTSIWTCLVRPIPNDRSIRIEIIVGTGEKLLLSSNIALSGLLTLCNHGLPIAIPTVILEADERTRLSQDHLEEVIDQISLALDIPKDQLRKRRHFSSSLNKLC